MDHTSEEGVKKQLREYASDKTLLVVTHRTSLLDLVDRIIVLDQGRIVADGPKAQVVEALRQGRIGEHSHERFDVLLGDEAHAVRLEQAPLRARRLLWGALGVVILLILWSAYAEIDEVTRGQGRVIPSGQVQVIQAVDGGSFQTS